IRIALSLLLTVKGHRVLSAPDITTALELFAASPPDVVISDMIMPGGHGLDAIQAIRTVDADVRIIAMSGGGRLRHQEYLSLAIAVGADACLEKPFEADDLLRLLTRE
ncbi:MAG: response regulator, partial [Microvirga sp.]